MTSISIDIRHDFAATAVRRGRDPFELDVRLETAGRFLPRCRRWRQEPGVPPELLRRAVGEHRMWAHTVVIVVPFAEQPAHFGERRDQCLVEALAAQLIATVPMAAIGMD